MMRKNAIAVEHERNGRRPSPASRAGYAVLVFVVLAIPGCVGWLMMLSADGDLLCYTPKWSDELFNWHQVATFAVAGFDGGYYTVNEMPAPLAWTHFYSHGPVYPLLVGTLGRLFGWELYSAPILNVALTTLAVALFVYSTRPGTVQLLLLGAILLTCWPLHLYMFTDMRLAFFDALAILLAACFCRTIADPGRASRGFLVVFAGLIVLASLAKVTWALLLIPYLLHIRARTRLSLRQALALSFFLLVLAFLAHSLLTAPYPNFAGSLTDAARRSVVEGAALLARHAGGGLASFVDITRPLWLLLRLQIVVCAGWAGLLVWRDAREGEAFREGVVVLASTGLLLVLTILLYDFSVWRDFRLFAPAVLLATLVFIARRRFVLVGLLLVGNLAVLPDFVSTYERVVKGRYRANAEQLQAFADQLSPIVRYQPQGGGWQNTILVPLRSLADQRLLAVPAGIGISWFKSPDRLQRIHSRYLLLDRRSRPEFLRRARLEFVRKTDLGDLYINHDAG